MLYDHVGLSHPVKSDLGDLNFGGFGGTKEDIVMRGIETTLEAIRSKGASEMVAASRGHVEGSKDFFVLNIPSAWREFLGSKAEFSEFSRDRIRAEFCIVCCDCFGMATEELGFDNGTAFHAHHSKGSVFVAHGEFALGTDWNEVDFACGKVGDIGSPSAEAMAFLSFLSGQFEAKHGFLAEHFKIDLHPIGMSHPEPEFFSGKAYLIVIHG